MYKSIHCFFKKSKERQTLVVGFSARPPHGGGRARPRGGIPQRRGAPKPKGTYPERSQKSTASAITARRPSAAQRAPPPDAGTRHRPKARVGGRFPQDAPTNRRGGARPSRPLPAGRRDQRERRRPRSSAARSAAPQRRGGAARRRAPSGLRSVAVIGN